MLYMSGAFNIIESILFAMVWAIPIGITSLISYLCSKSTRELPEVQRDLSSIQKITYPKFKIYKFYDDEKKLIGHLEGYTVYEEDNKYIRGLIDDRDPNEILFVYKRKIVQRMRDNKVYWGNNDEATAQIKELELTSLGRYTLNSHIEVDRSKSKAVIFRDYEEETKKIGTIEGDVKELNDARAWAIYWFIFEFFA